MRLWPFKKKSKEHSREEKVIEDVERRQKRVELELHTIIVQHGRHKGR